MLLVPSNFSLVLALSSCPFLFMLINICVCVSMQNALDQASIWSVLLNHRSKNQRCSNCIDLGKVAPFEMLPHLYCLSAWGEFVLSVCAGTGSLQC